MSRQSLTSQFFRRTHGRTLKIKASLSFFGLVTKQLPKISQRIKRSSFKWRTNPGQHLFDAWLPRGQKERYRSLNWECWGSSKTAKQGLGRLAMLAKASLCKRPVLGTGTVWHKAPAPDGPRGFPETLAAPRSHAVRGLLTANCRCFLGNTADICCIWSSHFHTGHTLTSFLLSHLYLNRWQQTVHCLVTLKTLPYLFFPSFLVSSYKLRFHSLLHSGQKF